MASYLGNDFNDSNQRTDNYKDNGNEGSRGRWTKPEQQKFLEALNIFGKNWKKVEEYVGTRTGAQIRSHAQKYFIKLERKTNSSQIQPGATTAAYGNTRENGQDSPLGNHPGEDSSLSSHKTDRVPPIPQNNNNNNQLHNSGPIQKGSNFLIDKESLIPPSRSKAKQPKQQQQAQQSQVQQQQQILQPQNQPYLPQSQQLNQLPPQQQQQQQQQQLFNPNPYMMQQYYQPHLQAMQVMQPPFPQYQQQPPRQFEPFMEHGQYAQMRSLYVEKCKYEADELQQQTLQHKNFQSRIQEIHSQFEFKPYDYHGIVNPYLDGGLQALYEEPKLRRYNQPFEETESDSLTKNNNNNNNNMHFANSPYMNNNNNQNFLNNNNNMHLVRSTDDTRRLQHSHNVAYKQQFDEKQYLLKRPKLDYETHFPANRNRVQ